MTKTATLVDAMNDKALTANGALTNASSLDKVVDLFFLAGASRGKDLSPQFIEAYKEDANLTARLLLWLRDVRGGSGEREQFRNLFRTLITESAGGPLSRRILAKIPEMGRWDDLTVAFGTELEREALRMIAQALVTDRNGLCAKWMPRPGKPEGNKIRAYLRLTPKNYRKLLAELSNTVEQKMCANEWDKITYDHVPSVAAARYQKAFGKHDPSGYSTYRTKLATGDATVNAAAVYPYDVIKSLEHGDSAVAVAQWKALPDYLAGSKENILPVVDVSGSMKTSKIGKTLDCMDVAISLGLYISERNKGLYQDSFITFSAAPELVTLRGNLQQRYDQLRTANWQQNTNLQAVFETILDAAVQNKIDAAAMPTMLLILSDMEFDRCVTVGPAAKKKDRSMSMWWADDQPLATEPQLISAMSMIEERYKVAGYKVPQIVFWNLSGRPGNVPVKYNKAGAALVSGFSPAIMKSLLGGAELTPTSVMLKTLLAPRYDL